MINLANNEYWNVFYNEQYKTIETKWTKASATMSEQEFKQHIIEFAQFVAMYKPNGFITDSQDGHFIMTPDFQIWHDEEIIPIYVKSGIKKIAFVLPSDIFEATSLEQTFDEEQAKVLVVKHFKNADAAFKWIRM